MIIYLLLSIDRYIIIQAFSSKHDAELRLKDLHNKGYYSLFIEEYPLEKEEISNLINSLLENYKEDNIYDISNLFNINWDIYDRKKAINDLNSLYL